MDRFVLPLLRSIGVVVGLALVVAFIGSLALGEIRTAQAQGMSLDIGPITPPSDASEGSEITLTDLTFTDDSGNGPWDIHPCGLGRRFH